MKPKEENATAQIQVNQTNNNMNIIDFTSVCGEGTVAQTAKIDQQVVNDLFNGFMTIPSSVVVKFRNESGYLKMIVNMTLREKFFRCFETYADAKLVESVIGTMRGTMLGALNVFKAEEHPLEISEQDPRIELFRQFMESPMRCRFDSDFIAGNGDRYISASFQIGYRKEVKFCLKRTDEIENIINAAIKAA